MLGRIGWFAGGLATGAGVRRMSTRTGVTDAEAYLSLPGDDVIRQPMVQWTRGVSVGAPAAAVWPWLVQAGYGRAGWYTPRTVDRIMEPILFRTRVTRRPENQRLHPELQHLEIGDIVADGPDFAAFFRVIEMRPQQAIVYYSIRHPWRDHPVDAHDSYALQRVERELLARRVYLEFTWSFVLRPDGPSRTRLLVRTRSMYSPKTFSPLVPVAGLFDATYGVAMLRAIARRAEATTDSDLRDLNSVVGK